MAIKISATIITYNEEKNIQRCIDSLDFVDEIIVVDSLSSDKTVEIAKNLGAKVIDQKFLGHIAQKQLAVDSTSNDWIISLDADEEVSIELKESILKLCEKALEYDAYSMNRISFHLGRWIKHGGWYPDKKIRFFNKQKSHWGGYNPHDKVIVDGSVGHINEDLKHYVFENLRHNVDANNSYSSIMADDLDKNEKKFSYLKLFIKPLGKFLETYIYKRGFLDGMAGFIISVGASYSMFLKFAKLWEIQKSKFSTTKYEINETLENFEEFLLNIKEHFSKNSDTIHKARNELKVISYEKTKTVVKAFKIPHKLNQFVYANYRDSKAKKSYKNAKKLEELNINTPKPIGFIEFYEKNLLKESFFISEKLDYLFVIREPLTNKSLENREQIIKGFVAFTYNLHKNGVYHKDYSAGNILVTYDGANYDFSLVDINRMEFKKVDVKLGLDNFAKLWLDEENLVLIASEYAKLANIEECEAIDILKKSDKKLKGFVEFKRKIRGK